MKYLMVISFSFFSGCLIGLYVSQYASTLNVKITNQKDFKIHLRTFRCVEVFSREKR